MSGLKEYSKGRDFISSAKMNYFHYFLKQLTGYTLHPSITSNLPSRPLRIADMGAQTAIWSIDVAEDPSLSSENTIHGFDVSNAFFPPAAWLPPNVALHVHDITKPFPPEYLGTFDIVHFRMFIMVPESTVSAMLEQAMALLKPGGFIQWIEHDKTSLHPITATPGADTSAIQAMITMEQSPFPNYNAAWTSSLPTALQTAGFSVLAQDKLQTKPSMVLQMHELHMLAMLDVPAGLSAAIDEFKEKWMDRVVREAGEGVSSVDGFVWIVGRKSLTEGSE